MKNFKDVFNQLANDKQNTALHHAQYCVIKALKAKANNKREIAEALLRRAFTPITNTNKLDNGCNAYDAMHNAIRMASRSKVVLGQPVEEILNEVEYAEYKAILDDLVKQNFVKTEKNYMFIFVRQDISAEQQAVQSAHACLVAGSKLPDGIDPHEVHFVLVGVPDEDSLTEARLTLEDRGHTAYTFVEPDLGDQLTAVASGVMKDHERRFLKHYKKLQF